MSKLLVMAVPILPNKTELWKKFTGELNSSRLDDFKQSRKNLGIRERTFLQQTPQGDMVIVTLEGEDPASAFAKFAANNDEFSTWFAAQVKEIHGLDLRQPPPGPMPELVIDTQQ